MNEAEKNTEIASLRNQIISLNTSLASMEAFVATTKQTVADIERRVIELEGGKDAEIEALGNQNELVPSQRCFPNEIFVEIGSYQAPGSRTLLNLAATCKDLFELLLPRLWARLTSKEILDTRFDYCLRQIADVMGVEHVKELRFVPIDLPSFQERTPALVNGALQVLKACSDNLRHLQIDMRGISSVPDSWLPLRLPNVEVLELDGAPETFLHWFVEVCLNVRKMSIWQPIADGDIDLRVWRRFGEKLQKLDDLPLLVGKDHRELAKLPGLLSKIKTFSVTCCHSLLELAQVAEFRPTTVSWDQFLEWPDLDEEDSLAERLWRAIVGVDGLKHFNIDFFPADLLRTVGLPPNLESLNVSLLEPLETRGVQVLEELRAKIPAGLKDVSIDGMYIAHVPKGGTPEWNDLLDELVFWDSLNDPGHRLRLENFSIELDSPAVEALENQVWEQKAFLRKAVVS